MGRSVRLENHDDITEEQIESLAVNDSGIDATTIEDINDIRRDIGEEMSKARMDGILNEKDANELQRELDRNSTDKQSIIQVANKVKSVIDENKNLIDNFVQGLTSERNIDNKLIVEDHLKRFKALSTEEKKTYVKNLRGNLDWLETLYKEVLQHSPEKVSDFRRMTGKEKKAYVEELKKRSENIKTYRGLIEANREHFSKESEEEYMTQFKELKTVAEQQRWIGEFSGEIKRKAEVTEKFKAYPREIQDKFPSFFEARRNQRHIILQKMEKALEESHLDVLNNDPNAKYFSEKDRAEAMKWWRQSPTETRIIMLKSLPGHLKKTAEISKKYEAMSDGVKLDVQKKLGFNNFYQLDFEEKTKAVEEAQKLHESGEKMAVEYGARLKDAVAKKYMSQATANDFMKEFKDITVAEKHDWMEKFETHELAKRKEVTEKFRTDVPKDVQEKNAAFYEMGYHDRVKLIGKLLGIEESEMAEESPESTEKGKMIAGLSNEAMQSEREGNNAVNADLKKRKWAEAIHAYEKLLKLEPDDDIAKSNHQRLVAKFKTTFPDTTIPEEQPERNLSDTETSQALEKAKQGEVMKAKIKHQTIADEITGLAAKSELYNANTVDSRKKEKHLGTEFERELNEKLIGHTGGNMVLTKEGKAQTINKVDVKQVGKLNVYELQKEVTKNRGEKGRNLHHLQLNNRDSGELVNAKKAREKVDQQQDKLQKELAARAARSLKERGEKLNQKDIEKLNTEAANDDLRVKLQDAA